MPSGDGGGGGGGITSGSRQITAIIADMTDPMCQTQC